MKIKWLKGNQYHNEFGFLTAGTVLNVPSEVGKNWIESGHAEEVKPKRKSEKEVKEDG